MRNSNCGLCTLSKSSPTVCLWGHGSAAQSGVMVIGDAPSSANMAREEYLSGGPGQVLKKALEAVGLTEYYVTGVVKCQPPDKKKVEPAECKACSVYLQDEIREQKPKYVLVLGATAAKAVCKAARLGEVVGKFIEKDGITYVPCYSSAFVLRDPSKENEFKNILKRFSDLVRGVKTERRTDLRIRVIDRSNLDEFCEQFKREKEFTCDLETSGLDYYNPDSYINCVGMYLPLSDTAWVLPIRKAPTLPEDAQRKLLHWMADQGTPVTNQNWKFDSLWLWFKFGVEFYNKDDTMLMHYCIDENALHGLKENARLWLNAPDYDLTTSQKKGNIEAKLLFQYCAWDCYYTWELKKLYKRELMKDAETRNIYEHLMMPASRMYEVIERGGNFVNLDRMEKVRKELAAKLENTVAALNRMVGHEVNWNSSAQVGKALYGDLGLTPSVFTEKGAPSSGEEALASLDHPVVHLLTEYRGVQKMLSTYIDGWKEYMVGPYLYLGTKLHGTVTGRFSSRLHQVPRDGTIRNLIEAPEGWTFIQADLSQAELRIAAILSRDPELIRCYAENIDVHWRTAMGNLRLQGSGPMADLARETVRLWGGDHTVPFGQIIDQMMEMGHDEAIRLKKDWKEIRKQAKATNFGFLYGMGVNKFTEYAKVKYQWDVSKTEAQDIKDAFFSNYSALPLWHDRQKSLVKIDGFVRSLSGRKRRLPGIWSPDRMLSSECERQAINSPVQGMIGDLKVMGMLSVYENLQKPDGGQKLQIRAEVHDSILMWVKNEHLNEMLPRIKMCMEHPDWLDRFGIELPVPIVADIEVGTWGKGKTWKGEEFNA